MADGTLCPNQGEGSVGHELGAFHRLAATKLLLEKAPDDDLLLELCELFPRRGRAAVEQPALSNLFLQNCDLPFQPPCEFHFRSLSLCCTDE